MRAEVPVMANEIVHVPFHGDVIEASQDEAGNIWVPIRRPCESLGLAPNNQIEKLKTKAWARDMMIISHDASGRSQEVYALHLDCLPMWLAGINASKVKATVRAKLELYQREAAKVLANHFLGKKEQTQPTIDVATLTGQIAAAVAQVMAGMFADCQRISNLITVEDRCKQRWPGATPKIRHRVRDVAIGIYRERLGRHPFKLTGYQNGTVAFEREHLDILDMAIDVVMESVSKRLAVPLFDRSEAKPGA